MESLGAGGTSADAIAVTITVAGAPLVARAGDSVAAALLADGRVVIGRQADGRPRAPFCLTGSCQQCWLTVDDTPDVPACTTQVREGMRIELQAPVTDNATDPAGEPA